MVSGEMKRPGALDKRATVEKEINSNASEMEIGSEVLVDPVVQPLISSP